MLNKDVVMKKGIWQSATSLLLFLTGSAIAAPAIEGVSGTFNHKGTVTITGSGFETKNPAAPLVWDDASGSNILDKWTGGYPVTTDRINYRTPIRGVPLPHSNTTKYIAGAHTGGTGDPRNGMNVAIWKYYSISSYPQPVFHSYYYRIDPAWNFCSGDNNFKLFSHSMDSGIYLGNYWYYEHRNPDLTRTSNPGIHTAYIPGSSGGRSFTFLNDGPNPINNWVKMEMEAMYTNQSNGYVKIWRNGTQSRTYNGATDSSSTPGGRSEAIGGFARCDGQPNNWRYFADVYLDTSLARIVLANSSTLSSATIKEMQIPSAWSNQSITATVNLGRFTAGQTAYLFVFDRTGIANTTGFPITVGGSGGGGGNPFGDWDAHLRIIQQ